MMSVSKQEHLKETGKRPNSITLSYLCFYAIFESHFNTEHVLHVVLIKSIIFQVIISVNKHYNLYHWLQNDP